LDTKTRKTGREKQQEEEEEGKIEQRERCNRIINFLTFPNITYQNI